MGLNNNIKSTYINIYIHTMYIIVYGWEMVAQMKFHFQYRFTLLIHLPEACQNA